MVVSPTAVYRCLKLETFRLSKFAQSETTFQVLTILGSLPISFRQVISISGKYCCANEWFASKQLKTKKEQIKTRVFKKSNIVLPD